MSLTTLFFFYKASSSSPSPLEVVKQHLLRKQLEQILKLSVDVEEEFIENYFIVFI